MFLVSVGRWELGYHFWQNIFTFWIYLAQAFTSWGLDSNPCTAAFSSSVKLGSCGSAPCSFAIWKLVIQPYKDFSVSWSFSRLVLWTHPIGLADAVGSNLPHERFGSLLATDKVDLLASLLASLLAVQQENVVVEVSLCLLGPFFLCLLPGIAKLVVPTLWQLHHLGVDIIPVHQWIFSPVISTVSRVSPVVIHRVALGDTWWLIPVRNCRVLPVKTLLFSPCWVWLEVESLPNTYQSLTLSLPSCPATILVI